MKSLNAVSMNTSRVSMNNVGNALVAQLVERHLAKVDAEGSSPSKCLVS